MIQMEIQSPSTHPYVAANGSQHRHLLNSRMILRWSRVPLPKTLQSPRARSSELHGAVQPTLNQLAHQHRMTAMVLDLRMTPGKTIRNKTWLSVDESEVSFVG